MGIRTKNTRSLYGLYDHMYASFSILFLLHLLFQYFEVSHSSPLRNTELQNSISRILLIYTCPPHITLYYIPHIFLVFLLPSRLQHKLSLLLLLLLSISSLKHDLAISIYSLIILSSESLH